MGSNNGKKSSEKIIFSLGIQSDYGGVQK